MIITQRPAQQVVRTVDRRTIGWIGLFGLFGVNIVIVTLLFVQAGPSDNVLITVGRLLGLYATVVLAFHLLLIARVPWLDRRIGTDRSTSLHRWAGFTLLFTLAAHILLVVSGYAQDEHTGVFNELVTLIGSAASILAGAVAFGLILLVGVTSAKIARRHLRYETWHAVHFVTYAALVLAFLHQLGQSSSFGQSQLARVYMYVLWGGALGAILVCRVLTPVIRNLRHQFRVAAVVAESPDVVSVYVTGKDLHKLPARAGQFFVWRFQLRGRRFRANPFSLSAAPDGRYLRLTAKAVGSGSAGLRDLAVGTRVFAAGPYGAFTTANQAQSNALLIAGGVGVTPIRALLETIPGHVVVLYRVRTHQDAVLLRELQDIARARGAVVHLLTGPSVAYQNYGPPLSAASIAAMVPDVAHRDVFVCGPSGMTTAVLATMKELRVPARQVHSERFAFAG